jgi:NAD(P)-dependent dehydrogenase (short-subunit alcohol dehydrogenase family)
MKKIVLITGAYGGIGEGLVRAFLKNDYDVIATGRREEELVKLQDKLKNELDKEIGIITVDGGNEEDVIRAFEEVKEKYGRLDALINNAQASKSGLMLVEHTKEDFDLAINSGLYATFFFMKYAHPLLKESKGSVINFASGAGLFGKVAQSSYAAAKEGIRGMSRVAATEWGADGIRVNVICPLVMTPKLEAWREAYPEAYEKTIRDIPMGRMADPEGDIGELCVFLSSDKASYITGETFTVQGGSGLRP